MWNTRYWKWFLHTGGDLPYLSYLFGGSLHKMVSLSVTTMKKKNKNNNNKIK